MDAMIDKIVAKPMPSLDAALTKGAEVVTDPNPKPQQSTDPHPPKDVIPERTEALQPIPDGGTEAAPAQEGTEPPPATPEALTTEIKAEDATGETVLRARDPKTGQFTEMDQTRTYELSLKDKVTGEVKVYQKSLPDLMRLAKDGISTQKYQNELRQGHDELSYYRQNVTKWQQAQQTVEQERDGFKALAMELLTSPEELVVQRRDAYAADQSPERQLARIQQQLAAKEQELAAKQQSWQYQQHVSTATARIAPAVQKVEQLVGQDAAAGKLMRDTMALMVNGQIPPQHFPQLIAYVEGPYLQWAEGEAAKRSGSTAETAKLAEAAKRLQAQNQQLVNTTGRALAPSGTGQPGEGARKPYTSANDAIEGIALGRGRRSA